MCYIYYTIDFERQRIEFESWEEAAEWAKETFDTFDTDLIHYID